MKDTETIDEKVLSEKEHRQRYERASGKVKRTTHEQSLEEIYEQKLEERTQQKYQSESGLHTWLRRFKEAIGMGDAYQAKKMYASLEQTHRQANQRYQNTITLLENVQDQLSEVRNEKIDVKVFLEASESYYRDLLVRKDRVHTELEAMAEEGMNPQVHEKRDEYRSLQKTSLQVHNDGTYFARHMETLDKCEKKLEKKASRLTNEIVYLNEQVTEADLNMKLYDLDKQINGEFNPRLAHDLYEQLGVLNARFNKLGGDDYGAEEFDERFSPNTDDTEYTNPTVEAWRKLPKPE